MRLPHAVASGAAQSARLLPCAAGSSSSSRIAGALTAGSLRYSFPCRHRRFSQCHYSMIQGHTRHGGFSGAGASGGRRQLVHHLAREDEETSRPSSASTGSSEDSSSPQKAAKGQALPAPPEKHEPVVPIDVGGPGVKLDYLGPLVVNKDGTTGRVANWAEMTEGERETTLKLLTRRNKQRLEALKKGESSVRDNK